MRTDSLRFRLFSLLLAVLLLGGLAAPVGIAEEAIPSGLRYEVYEDSVIIFGYTGNETTLLLPANIEGKPVKIIAYGAFQSNTRLQSLIIPIGVTSISPYAFSGCSSLGSISIPGTVSNIGNSTLR